MARYARRRKSVRPFRAMRKARAYRSRGLYAFGRSMYKGARSLANAVHTFRKQVMLDTITDTGADRHLSYQFNLDQLQEEKEFQDLYDAYRIKKIILTLEPQFSGTQTPNTGPYQRWIRIVHDYDDITPLTNQNQYLEYAGCKSRLAASNKVIKIPLYPKIQVVNESAGGNSITRPVNPTWIPTASDQVDHLGLKIFVPTLGLTQGFGIFNVRATFIVQCKNSK